MDAWSGDARLYLQPLVHQAIQLGVTLPKLEENVKEFVSQIPTTKDDGALLFSVISSGLLRCRFILITYKYLM